MPYSIFVRSALLKLIEKVKVENGFPSEEVKNKALAMYSFYRNPAPYGHEYVTHEEFINSEAHRVKLERLEELVGKKIPRSRSKAKLKSYESEALNLSIELWEKSHTILSGPDYRVLTQPLSPAPAESTHD